jgi:hypothetical protein
MKFMILLFICFSSLLSHSRIAKLLHFYSRSFLLHIIHLFLHLIRISYVCHRKNFIPIRVSSSSLNFYAIKTVFMGFLRSSQPSSLAIILAYVCYFYAWKKVIFGEWKTYSRPRGFYAFHFSVNVYADIEKRYSSNIFLFSCCFFFFVFFWWRKFEFVKTYKSFWNWIGNG